MASNPMQRQARNYFLLGMVITLLIAGAVVALLFMQIKKLREQNSVYENNISMVYVLNQDVKLPEKFIKPENIKLDNREYYNLLSKCINNHNKCYIEYYSKEHDKMTKRIIRPYNLMVLDNEWGVAAYCENKQEIRHFYLNRITLIKELEEKY